MSNTFVENKLGLKILTDKGYKDFAGIMYKGEQNIFKLEFGQDKWLECTEDHKCILSDYSEVPVSKLNIGDKLYSLKGKPLVLSNIINMNTKKEVYDVMDVEGNKFFANDILVHNCEFITVDETLIDSIFLQNGFQVKKEITKLKNNVYLYEEIEPNKAYTVSLDPALGTGYGDYAAIQIFSLPDLKQVGEWRSQSAQPPDQVRVLLNILIYIYNKLADHPDQEQEPDIYWSLENNNCGEAVVQLIKNYGEDNFPGWFIKEPKARRAGGLYTTNRSKLLACSKLKTLIEKRKMTINSPHLINELKHFVSSGASFAAQTGTHDDLVSACLLTVRILDIISLYNEEIYDVLNEDFSEEEDYEYDGMPIIL